MEITEATLPWVILFTVILVGAAYGFGMMIRDFVALIQRHRYEQRVAERFRQAAFQQPSETIVMSEQQQRREIVHRG